MQTTAAERTEAALFANLGRHVAGDAAIVAYDRRPAAESALELLLLADIQASADRLSDIVQARGIFVRRLATSSWFAGRPDAEELNGRADRLECWVVALMSVNRACGERVPA